MFRLGRMLAEKVGDLQQAAQRLSDVVRLYPRDDKALDALAAVFANPQWTGADGPERAAGLYTQIARRRHEAGDIDNAVAALRKALGAVPSHADASALMERVLTDAGRLADLDRFLRERVATARTTRRNRGVVQAAQLARTSLNDMAEATRIYQDIVALEPPGGNRVARAGRAVPRSPGLRQAGRVARAAAREGVGPGVSPQSAARVGFALPRPAG